ncbi:MAG: universal stress protein [Solirubrobacteraceae bacterium]
MFENVVVGVKDLQAGRDAVWLAQALAARDRSLTLAHVQVAATKPAAESGAVGSAARRREALGMLAALRDESQLDAEVAWAEAKAVSQGLHEMARARNADLLVIGASREDEIYRDLVGDAVYDVLNDPPCAVAVAPAAYCDHRAPWRTIGMAYGGAADSDEALAVAKELAADRHAKLSAFHAVSGLHRHDPRQFEESMDDEAALASDRLERLEGVEAHAAYGDPAQEISRYAGSVDLLVLGMHKHGRVGRLFGRGTARQLADDPVRPLLVVPGKSAPHALAR